MAKGSTQKGMRMIGPTLGHQKSRSNSQIQQPLSILPDPRHPSIQGLAPTSTLMHGQIQPSTDMKA
ncbi:hypothetical protein M404DRAFT_33034 [Pisolithus tinctorius Marx 270]|uniref:Uncharacterized protein n=1 Tax=Pisolithus tinctorius Marx 270 TaxID=870435 RepID=A0A0C3NM34_PISTI|nr:hypothetical protein M404DRAFT_33034 [Pisolithus tinctorius Marx 270]